MVWLGRVHEAMHPMAHFFTALQIFWAEGFAGQRRFCRSRDKPIV